VGVEKTRSLEKTSAGSVHKTPVQWARDDVLNQQAYPIPMSGTHSLARPDFMIASN